MGSVPDPTRYYYFSLASGKPILNTTLFDDFLSMSFYGNVLQISLLKKVVETKHFNLYIVKL